MQGQTTPVHHVLVSWAHIITHEQEQALCMWVSTQCYIDILACYQFVAFIIIGSWTLLDTRAELGLPA